MFTVLVNNKQKRQKPVDEKSVSPPRLGRCARSSQAGIDVAIAPIAMLSEASLIAQSSNEGEASNADVSSWIEDCSGTVVLLPVPVRRAFDSR